MIRERDIEKYLTKSVKKAGGEAWKLTSPGRKGVPDRLCIFDLSRIYFIEVKKPDGVLTALQDRTIRRLRAKGHQVWVVKTYGDVDQFIDSVNST